MRQQPYEHLISVQNVCTQNTATCETQNFASNASASTHGTSAIGGLSSLLKNPANLSKIGGLLGNMLKSDQSVAQSQNGNILPQNAGFDSRQTQQSNNIFSFLQQSAQQSNGFPKSSENAPTQSVASDVSQNGAQGSAQNFPTANPQYALETLLNPQFAQRPEQSMPPHSKKQPQQAQGLQTENSQCPCFQKNNAQQNNRNSVLKQMQLHNDYLARIPHN